MAVNRDEANESKTERAQDRIESLLEEIDSRIERMVAEEELELTLLEHPDADPDAYVVDPSVVDEEPCRRDSARSRMFVLIDAADGRGPMIGYDIGLGGLLCRTRAVRLPGTFLDLSFTLPGTAEQIRIGSQVVSLDAEPNGEAILGLRFCMPSRLAQMAIYRFLDARRALWDEVVIETRRPHIADLDFGETPFQALLLEAEAALKAQELSAAVNAARPIEIRQPRSVPIARIRPVRRLRRIS